MITVDDLLDGPRGRRFLFELLVATLPDDSAAVRRVLRHVPTLGSARTPRIDGQDAVRELAAALDAAPLADPTPEQVVVAVEETAESAVWWQRPHAADVALAETDLRGALHRLGEWAVGASTVRRLFEPMTDRWCVETEQWPRVQDRPPAASTLQEWAHDLRSEQILGTGVGGGGGAWWTDPPWPTVWTTGAPFRTLGPLALWAVEDSFGPEHAVVLDATDRRSARVRTIDTVEDWADLCRRWPLDVSRTTRRNDWQRATGRDSDWVVPDWSGVAEDHDVVHLTAAGWFRTSGVAIPVDADTSSVVAGWMPDMEYWLTDPAPTTGAPVLWLREQNTGPWHRGDV